jgi:hypothetical protein
VAGRPYAPNAGWAQKSTKGGSPEGEEKVREIKIKAALNGWTAQVGCQTLVYVDQQALLKDLGEYMADPKAKEKVFVEAAINKRLLTEGVPCAEQTADAPALNAVCATPPSAGRPIGR